MHVLRMLLITALCTIFTSGALEAGGNVRELHTANKSSARYHQLRKIASTTFDTIDKGKSGIISKIQLNNFLQGVFPPPCPDELITRDEFILNYLTENGYGAKKSHSLDRFNFDLAPQDNRRHSV